MSPRFRIPYINITIFSIVKSKNQPRLLGGCPENGARVKAETIVDIKIYLRRRKIIIFM